MSTKEKIANIIWESLDNPYCYNCRNAEGSNRCEDCNRKRMMWQISEAESDRIADRIVKEVINAQEC